MNSILKRIQRLEESVQGKEIPPLFISSYHKEEVLGFRNGDATVMRLEGESFEDLQTRALETLRKEPGAIMLTAICKSWGNWPYMPELAEDDWCREAKEYYKSIGVTP